MKNKSKMLIVISYFHKEKARFIIKKPRYKKGTKKITYYNNNNDNLVKTMPIEDCTLEDIERILLKVYPDEKHIEKDKYGNKYLYGGYDITPELKKLLFEEFNIEVDIENFDCQLEEEYESDI